MFSNENNLDDPQNTELKIIMTEEFKKLKEDTKIQSNDLKKSEFKENKCLTDDQ